MIASASVARFDGLFKPSERSIHIVGIRSQILPQAAAGAFMKRHKAAFLKFCCTNNQPVFGKVTEVKFQSL